MHDTREKVNERPMTEWSLDELIEEHSRLRSRFEDETNKSPDIGDVLWMIEIGCELRDRGIEIVDDYELIEK